MLHLKAVLRLNTSCKCYLGLSYSQDSQYKPMVYVFVWYRADNGPFLFCVISEFVKEAQKGGKGNLPIDGTLEIVKTEAWDGKDGEVVDADEFSLEELMADD